MTGSIDQGRGSMTGSTDPVIVGQIAAVIRDAVAEDWIQEFAIGPDTSFNDDLELESIEFVTIASGLQQHFGSGIDLISWLSTRGFDQLIALRVGHIAEFVAHALKPQEA
jgi:acyl carrier protein